MMRECPHCYRRVLPLASGECPACHENTADGLNTDQNVTLLSIMEATKFPKACCTCNEPTEHTVKIERSGRMAGAGETKGQAASAMDAVPLMFLGLLGKLIYMFAQTAGQSEAGGSTLRIYVPQCKRCVAEKKVTAASVDLEHHRLSILADRRFAAAVDELNRR